MVAKKASKKSGAKKSAKKSASKRTKKSASKRATAEATAEATAPPKGSSPDAEPKASKKDALPEGVLSRWPTEAQAVKQVKLRRERHGGRRPAHVRPLGDGFAVVEGNPDPEEG